MPNQREKCGAVSSTAEGLSHFTHEIKVVSCGLCSNHCRLTVNTFDGGRRFIGGNRCERPWSPKAAGSDALNIYAYKRELLSILTKRRRDGAARLVFRWGLTCMSFIRSGTPSYCARLWRKDLACVEQKALCEGTADHSVGYGLLSGKADARPCAGTD